MCVCVCLSRVDGSAVQASKSSRGTSGVRISRGWDPSHRALPPPKAFLHKTNAEPDPWWPRGKDRAALPRPASSALLCGEFDNTAQVHFTPATPGFTPNASRSPPLRVQIEAERQAGSNFTLRQARLAGHQPADSVPRAVNPLSPPPTPPSSETSRRAAAGVWILEESATPPETGVTSKPLLLCFEPQGDTAVLHSFKWPATVEPEATAPPVGETCGAGKVLTRSRGASQGFATTTPIFGSTLRRSRVPWLHPGTVYPPWRGILHQAPARPPALLPISSPDHPTHPDLHGGCSPLPKPGMVFARGNPHPHGTHRDGEPHQQRHSPHSVRHPA